MLNGSGIVGYVVGSLIGGSVVAGPVSGGNGSVLKTVVAGMVELSNTSIVEANPIV